MVAASRHFAGDAATCRAELLRAVLLTSARDHAGAILVDALADLGEPS